MTKPQSIKRNTLNGWDSQVVKREKVSDTFISKISICDDQKPEQVAAFTHTINDTDLKVAFDIQTDKSAINSVSLVPDTSDPSVWVLCWGRNPRFDKEGILVDGFVRSARSLSAVAGKKYILEYDVSMSHQPNFDGEFIFFAAPISLDITGQIIQTTLAQPPLSHSQDIFKHKVEIVAAEEADKIFVGFQGPISDEKPEALPLISNVRLAQI